MLIASALAAEPIEPRPKEIVIVFGAGLAGVVAAETLPLSAAQTEFDTIHPATVPLGPDSYAPDVIGVQLVDPDQRWGRFTDAMLMGLAPALVLVPPGFRDARGWALRAGAVGDGVLVTIAATEFLKSAVARPRPYTFFGPNGSWADDFYNGDAFATSDAFRSFPSGHTSIVAAASFGWTTLLVLENPGTEGTFWHDAGRPLMFGVPTALTVLVGIGRVEAGYHFRTDTIAGGVLGASAGILVPWLLCRPSGDGVAIHPVISSRFVGVAGTL